MPPGYGGCLAAAGPAACPPGDEGSHAGGVYVCGAGSRRARGLGRRASKSLTAYVARFGNDLLIPNQARYEREARASRVLPVGLLSHEPNALAILPAKFQEQIFGTLHVECEGEVSWEQSDLREALHKLAEMTALLLRDIVQNSKLARAREAAERQVAQAFGAIHGVKGPVQATRNYLGTLLDLYSKKQLKLAKAAELAEKAGIGLARIERLAVRLLRLVRERPAEVGRVDVADTLQSCVKEAIVLCPGVQVTWHMSGSSKIRCDRSELVNVVDELIMNSERAGATNVAIVVTGDTREWKMTVDDNGLGVGSDDLLERIFERWYHTFPGGAGLGLALVRKVVQDLGGTVIAEHAKPGLRIRIAVPDPVIGDDVERRAPDVPRDSETRDEGRAPAGPGDR